MAERAEPQAAQNTEIQDSNDSIKEQKMKLSPRGMLLRGEKPLQNSLDK